MSKNLILGSAFNYDIEKVKPFVLSLRRFYDGEVLFLINEDTDQATLDFYNEHNIYTYIPDEKLSKATGNVVRFYHYIDCLSDEHFEDTENVFLCDIRDIVFQSDPFENYPVASLEFFAEPELFKNCMQHNGPWYSRLYGQEQLEKIGEEYVLCAGTTMGKKDKIIQYISEMVKEITSLQEQGRAHGTCDQAVHNHLVYTNVFDDIRINQNDTGLVSTMHHSKILNFSREGYLLNKDGKPTPVVHQYDRLGAFSLVFLKNALQVKGAAGIRTVSKYATENFFDHDL